MESRKKYGEIWEVVEEVELVDGHCHNVVSVDSSFSFLKCFSEADHEEALHDVPHTLSFKRGIRDLASLYGCEESLDGVQSYRKSSGIDSICSKCFGAANIGVILVDDGLALDKMYDIEWHQTYAPIVGRILRIEHLAGKILDEGLRDGQQWTLEMFTELFLKIADKIIGLKSIAAYRSGLQIDTHVSKMDAEAGLVEALSARKPIRIQNKSFIDYIFMCSLEVAISFDLPVQIHTGFGDVDLDLRLSNPLHLRTALEDERFTKCRFVLLHASYPFSKEASYLASVYPQVYLDFGLAIPRLSVNGMISAVKELLELAPMNKVMFSTDAHAHPELFYLGAKNAREVIASVLCDACDDGDLTIPQAVDAAKDLLRRNALRFYKIETKEESLVSNKSMAHNIQPICKDSSVRETTFVRILWVDTSGQCRCRVVPGKRFYQVTKDHGVGLTFASMGMTSFSDGPAKGTNLTGVGEIRIMPDTTTKCRIPWLEQQEMVLADMQIKPGEAWEYCPRAVLHRVSAILKDEFNLEMNAGFENEFFLLKRVSWDGKQEWVPFDLTSYCSTSGFDAASSYLTDVNYALESLDIVVEQVHAEGGRGQFEIALGHKICTCAADKLIYAREAIKAIARKYGLLATFLPKLSPDDLGSGTHVHLSLWENGKNKFMAVDGTSTKYGMSNIGESFMAGVFHHLPAIMAFTAPLPNSYDRIQPSMWSGAYHCWGKENREAPLRTACPPGIANEVVSNFEVKVFDGCANPYLGLAAIMAAGIDGLRRRLTLPEPIDTDPCSLEGDLKRLPTLLDESIIALEGDEIIRDFIGQKVTTAVIGVRKISQMVAYIPHALAGRGVNGSGWVPIDLT
ncbi:hypothetical protein AMTR_s00140p00082700 [Amborella trichopoda]|uniref:GS catalytic domain-containing protein n=1 Tax=Amborella trichopoda TaxID=13333 RepID=W1PCM3_AMBTC|nr:hypothetical protein AMTR_s00140p00082700 [Amborella trichopoda]